MTKEPNELTTLLIEIEALTENDQLQESKNLRRSIELQFMQLHPKDQADITASLKPKKRDIFLTFITHHADPSFLNYLEKAVLLDVIDTLGSEKIGIMLSSGKVKQIVDVLEELPEDLRTNILEFIQYKKRIKIEKLLSYPELSVGRHMTLNFITVEEGLLVQDILLEIDQALKYRNKDTHTANIFITNHKHQVIGVVSMLNIIKANPHDKAITIIEEPAHILNALDSASSVVEFFVEHDVQTLPVVDENGKMIGVLEINSIANFISEQAEKSILTPVGVFEAKREGIFWAALARFIWLFVNFCTASAAASVISSFEPLISSFAVLASLMPIVASVGGNTGNQASAVVIRSLATKEFKPRLIFTEVSTSFLNAICFGVIAFAISFILYGNLMLSVSFGLAVFINLNIGGVMGCVLPLLVNKLKIDPALCSSIFVTMITDTMGFFSFLGIAFLLLT